MGATNSKIQLRRDTAANWSTYNPILSAGEIGIDSDANRVKIGDGVSTWSARPYLDEIISSLRVMHNEESLFNIITNYILNIDYSALLAFDTSEIVIGSTSGSTTAVLGQAILGQMILG